MSVIFKAGDRVTCVDGGDYAGHLTVGQTYSIFRVWEHQNEMFVEMVGDLGRTISCYSSRFVPSTSRSLDMEHSVPAPAVPPPTPSKADNVNQPHHYARFAIEPITFINANSLPYNIGNVVKYACRYDAKNGVEDLRKAIRYLEIHIETLERRDRVAAGEDSKDVWKTAL